MQIYPGALKEVCCLSEQNSAPISTNKDMMSCFLMFLNDALTHSSMSTDGLVLLTEGEGDLPEVLPSGRLKTKEYDGQFLMDLIAARCRKHIEESAEGLPEINMIEVHNSEKQLFPQELINLKQPAANSAEGGEDSIGFNFVDENSAKQLPAQGLIGIKAADEIYDGKLNIADNGGAGKSPKHAQEFVGSKQPEAGAAMDARRSIVFSSVGEDFLSFPDDQKYVGLEQLTEGGTKDGRSNIVYSSVEGIFVEDPAGELLSEAGLKNAARDKQQLLAAISKKSSQNADVSERPAACRQDDYLFNSREIIISPNHTETPPAIKSAENSAVLVGKANISEAQITVKSDDAEDPFAGIQEGIKGEVHVKAEGLQKNAGFEQIHSKIFDPIMKEVQLHQRVRADGSTEIKVKLEPESLGEVQIKISSEDGKLSGKIYVENILVKEALENRLPMFRERLAQLDVEIMEFDVFLGQDSTPGSDGEASLKQYLQPWELKSDKQNIEAGEVDMPVISAGEGLLNILA